MALATTICFFVTLLSVGHGLTDLQVQSLENQIVGGESVTIDTYPYQIQLLRNGAFICGGSIVGKAYILTAAHCVTNLDPTIYTIRAGSSYLGSGGVIKKVKSVKVHPRYVSTNLDYDVAVLELDSALTYGTTIKSVALATSSPAVSSVSTVTGWGTTSTNGSPSYQLQAVQLPLVSQLVCRLRYVIALPPYYVTDRMLCAGYLYVSNKDTCFGDSGGPLVYLGKQVGIVSFGRSRCNTKFPTVFADVPEFRSWIAQNAQLDA